MDLYNLCLESALYYSFKRWISQVDKAWRIFPSLLLVQLTVPAILNGFRVFVFSQCDSQCNNIQIWLEWVKFLLILFLRLVCMCVCACACGVAHTFMWVHACLAAWQCNCQCKCMWCEGQKSMSGVFLLLLILRVEMGSLTSLEYSMSHSRFLPVPTQPPRESQVYATAPSFCGCWEPKLGSWHLRGKHFPDQTIFPVPNILF